ncbi:complex I intermediate-associated protein 30, mitochondrial [Orussus abietinus]|uniref:complex I intermediate-associated protein 30, mitochondrial n=1 Tax=Orussus abietinus TaxID=222816 RepID=UPI000626D1CE|nr:complex I intermediate-associated protein 30, mitochondrial [Orussus abietinus]
MKAFCPLRLLMRNINKPKCNFHTSRALLEFYESDRKGGYPHIPSKVSEKKSIIKNIIEGCQRFCYEMKVLSKEVREALRADPVLAYRHNEVDVEWRFDGDPSRLEDWIVTCDSEYAEGFSSCSLQLSPRGTGIFSGILDTRVPKDGKLSRAGYCNITTARRQISFRRDTPLDWTQYSHLILRVRGDGRNYLINLATAGMFDIFWNDVHHYVLHTQGGPYWQYVKIPFSKFYLASKGRIQDIQYNIPLDQVWSIGFSLADQISGPFKLEIDYIGVEYDALHNEEFAYETYKVEKFIT